MSGVDTEDVSSPLRLYQSDNNNNNNNNNNQEEDLSSQEDTYKSWNDTQKIASSVTISSHTLIILCTAITSLYSLILYGRFPARSTPGDASVGSTCRYQRMHGFVLVVGLISLVQLIWLLLDMTFSLIGYRTNLLQHPTTSTDSHSTKLHQKQQSSTTTTTRSCSSNGSSIIRFFFQTFITFLLLFMATENWTKRQKCSIEQAATFHSMTHWLIVCFVFCAIHWLVYLAETIVLKWMLSVHHSKQQESAHH